MNKCINIDRRMLYVVAAAPADNSCDLLTGDRLYLFFEKAWRVSSDIDRVYVSL